MIDWREDLIDFMIEGGLIGRKQSEIIIRFDHVATIAQIVAELEFHAAEDKIQKFVMHPTGRKGGRSYIIWRATTKIMES
jgi:hypothetical protein